MTRKRFIKLCMSRGCSRNRANAIARSIRAVYPYAAYSVWYFCEQATSSLCYPIKNYKIRFLSELNMEGKYAEICTT